MVVAKDTKDKKKGKGVKDEKNIDEAVKFIVFFLSISLLF